MQVRHVIVASSATRKVTRAVGTDTSLAIDGKTLCNAIDEQADAKRLLQINRGLRIIENSCHYIIDWNYDEDRSRIRTRHGSESMTRLRRFAISLVKSKRARGVAQTMRQLNRSMRVVFDYLRMTKNSCPPACV